jgi:WD40 repeat protein
VAVTRPPGEVWCFKGLRSVIESVALSPDGKRGLSYGVQDGLLLWDLQGGKELAPLKLGMDRLTPRQFARLPKEQREMFVDMGEDPSHVNGLAFQDSRLALSAGSEVIIWDVRTGRAVRRFGGQKKHFWRVAVSPNGRHCLAADGSALDLFEMATGNEIRQFKGVAGPFGAGAIGFSADGARVLAAGGKEIAVWDLTGKELRRFKTSPNNESDEDAAFSANGKRAVTLSHGETLRVWDVETGKNLHTVEKLNHPQSVTLSADGSRALVGTWDGDLQYWDLNAGKEIRRYEGHSGLLKAVALTPDGRYALTGGHDDTVRFWDLKK